MGSIVVTGTSGFIGRAVVGAAADAGFRIIGFDRHPQPIHGLAEPWGGDILENFAQGCSGHPSLRELIADEALGVINLAGVLGTSELLDSIPDAIRYNTEAAARIFLACLEFDKPCVQISPGNHSWSSIYPLTKNLAESVALALNRDRGAKIAVVRAMNVFGGFQKAAPVRKLIPNLIRWALLNEPARIYGKGTQKMDAIYVDDCAEILVRALRHVIQTGRGASTVFEAGTGQAVTVNWMADRIWKEVRGVDVAPKIYEPMRPGEPPDSVTVANPLTLRPLGWRTGWEPAFISEQQFIDSIQPHFCFTTFDEALRETVAWYKDHPGFIGLPPATAGS